MAYDTKYMSAYDGRYRPVLPAKAARAELERLRSGEGGQSDPDYMLRDTVPMAAMAVAPAGYAAVTGMPLPAAGTLLTAPVAAGSAKGLARDVKRGVPLHESRYLLPVAMTAAAGTRFAGREIAGDLRHVAGGGPRAILPIGPNGMGNIARAGLSTAELEATASRFPGENVDMHFVRPALTAEGRAMLGADATLADRLYTAFRRRNTGRSTVGSLLKGRDAEVLAAAYPRTVGRTRVDVLPRAADGPLGEVLPRGRGYSIVLYRDDLPGRSMAPTFGHEFKHVLETQEPFAGGGAGSRSDPVVKRLAEDAVALAPAEERGAAYGRALKNMAYATSTGENTARAVGLMNETGSLSWRDLLRNPRKHIDFGNGGTVMIDTKDNPGYPVYVSGADLQLATSRYRGPVPPDQLDDKGGKGGDRFSMSRNFLATDKVPDTIFGIPVVSRREDYTKADLRFFQEHPEAGGYYDLGEETPEDGSEEGAPVQDDEPKATKFERGKFKKWSAYKDTKAAEAAEAAAVAFVNEGIIDAPPLSEGDLESSRASADWLKDPKNARKGLVTEGTLPHTGRPRFRSTHGFFETDPEGFQGDRFSSTVPVDVDAYHRDPDAYKKDGLWAVIPTIYPDADGVTRLHTGSDADAAYRKSGGHFGVYKGVDAGNFGGQWDHHKGNAEWAERRTRQDAKGGEARGKYPGIANNPGNVEKHERRTDKTLFKGEIGGDIGGGRRPKRFAVFSDPVDGLNAAAVTIMRRAADLAKDGKDFTIANYAPLYNPPTENDTAAYVRNLSKYSGIRADEVLDPYDTDQMSRLLKNVVRFESGTQHSAWFTDDEYAAAAELMKEGAID